MNRPNLGASVTSVGSNDPFGAPIFSDQPQIWPPASPEELLAFFDLAAVGLVEVDAATKTYIRVNRHFAEMTGYSVEELHRMSFLELAEPEDVAASVERFSRMMCDGEPMRGFELRLRRRDGAVIWVSVTATVVRDRSGQPARTVAVVDDISARKRQESNAAFLSELQQVLATATDVAVMLSVVSEKLTAHLDAVRVTFFEFDGDEAVELTAELESEKAAGISGFAEKCLDKASPTLDRGQLWVHAEPSLLLAPHAAKGHCNFVLAVENGTDRTTWREDQRALVAELTPRVWLAFDRIRALGQLRASERRLRRAMAIETVGIYFFDLSGTIVDANDAFLRMSGYSRRDVALHLLDRNRLVQNGEAALDELKYLGRTIPSEKQLSRSDGSSWWALLSASRISETQGVEFVIDITDRKSVEEQLGHYREQLEERVLERTAELDAVNGALLDEILERKRSELARHTLMGQLVAAQEDERRRISRELHDVVGQHLTALMLGLKSLPGAGAAEQTRTLADLRQLTEAVGKEIHELALELRPTALDDLGLLGTLSNYLQNWSTRTGVEVDFHHANWGSERLPTHIETTIYRITCEACTNIFKHARARRVSVILERRSDRALAIIEDDGRGFDSEHARVSAGTRLGLTGMQERAALVGGEVRIESGIGRGTTVFVRLPLTYPEASR